jgi:hypothetical protein
MESTLRHLQPNVDTAFNELLSAPAPASVHPFNNLIS